ncbi:polysaccharide biosynthesis protein [Bizionia saleffrena]|uniref:Polysaccharide biosynthesis protein n=1 Tax=Bizionia saleffrena TaxID=291189 RepID=A0A8H2QJC2_9FLAO|nr:polysaccharide biosynthesis protein [Bizionia saleffrena]TYB74204.1 polysaccharide biosynthesis protein [Bizionia saleffrena]
MFKNKCVLITGAAGTIGWALTHFILPFQPKKIILLDTAETPLFNLEHAINSVVPESTTIQCVLGSITNVALINKLLSENTIDFLLHTAAYKHVPTIEKQPIEGIQVNSLGTKLLADAALKNGVKQFVFMSTDKAVNPSSVMGATKLLAEKYIKILSESHPEATRFITVRFGNIIDSNGSVIPLFKAQLKENKPLTITHKKATRYLISVSKVVSLLAECLTFAKTGEILVFEMGKPQSIYDIATTTIQESGYNIQDIQIETIGLRPGEKLHEELVSGNTNLEPTRHRDIFVVNEPNTVPLSEINRAFQNLQKAVETYDALAAVKALKRTLKTYKSKNSEYEALD